MTKVFAVALGLLVVLQSPGAAAQQASPARTASRFAGTWVGTQSWNIPNPPPGARQDQPVTLTLEVVDGRITGTLKPFLGGEDGATIVDAKIVGEELQATAVVGRPRTPTAPPQTARRGTPPAGWKDPIRIAFTFRNEGLQDVNLTGTADVTMGDVPWTKFKYELSKKRSRY